MFVSSRRHTQEINRLTAELQGRDERIADLELRVYETERTRHELIEEVRYVIEAAGDHIGKTDSLRGERLHRLGHVLPYVLSGRRHWDGPEISESTQEKLAIARELAAEFDFSLPDGSIPAVKALLDLALSLFNPERPWPLSGLRNLYPVTKS